EVNSFFEEEQAVKIVVDSYTREIERYGTQTMEFSENIFFYDSLAICDFLSLIYGDEGEVLRGKFAFVNIDRLLDDFGYTIEDKKHLINNISESFI
ncbi:thiopeptide-type bacteriocin biosynthesis protein, partial [Staphylococcus caprae]